MIISRFNWKWFFSSIFCCYPLRKPYHKYFTHKNFWISQAFFEIMNFVHDFLLLFIFVCDFTPPSARRIILPETILLERHAPLVVTYRICVSSESILYSMIVIELDGLYDYIVCHTQIAFPLHSFFFHFVECVRRFFFVSNFNALIYCGTFADNFSSIFSHSRVII